MPSKVTDYKESALASLPKIMKKLNEQAMNPQDLYKRTRRFFDDVGEFVEALDCLFILNRIYIDEETGVISSVKAN
jgi:hypothetical protein